MTSPKRNNLPILRVLLIVFLVLLLQIPALMISGVISERESTRAEAITEVTGKWGGEQSIVGPKLIVPYLNKWIEETSSGSRTRTEIRYAHFLPNTLAISGRVASEVRYRGIFKVPVYRLDLEFSGDFGQPDFSDWEVEPDEILWERSHLVVKISDARSIQEQATLTWNGSEIGFLPGPGESEVPDPGIHAPVAKLAQVENGEFNFSLSLNGSVGVFFVPFGRDTTVQLESTWSDPSFQGSWLPTDRSIDKDGFDATWKIPSLGRNYPQKWNSSSSVGEAISASRFGVDLITPVDHYRMAQRSVKYSALFLFLTFGSLWLFEVLAGIRVHSLQYLLVGAGMCLFYLLELSLSEQLGFLAAYVIATASVVALIFGYSAAVLGGLHRASIMGLILTALYLYLYILLRNQDYALLVGSIGLFLILAGVMYLTRKVDWYSLKTEEKVQE